MHSEKIFPNSTESGNSLSLIPSCFVYDLMAKRSKQQMGLISKNTLQWIGYYIKM